MSKYSELMKQLDPRLIIQKTEIPFDNARAQYSMPGSTIRSFKEFEQIVVNYAQHVNVAWVGQSFPPEYCLDKARKFLDSSIGFDNAVHIGMSGAEGGMPSVLNYITEGFKQEAKQAYFRYTVDQFIDPLSFEQVVGFMAEFKRQLGSYSPESFNYISPEAMAVNYRDHLWNYINSLTKYKNLWAY